MRKTCSSDGWEGSELADKAPQGWGLQTDWQLVLTLAPPVFTKSPRGNVSVGHFPLSGETKF